MWCYESRTGKLFHDDRYVATGYAGTGEGKNNPDMQDDIGIGPIPVGRYTIGPPHDTPSHGPFVMELKPEPTNQMFGRSGFLMHGDSVKMPGTASKGCIILARVIREAVWLSGERQIEVVKDNCCPPKAIEGIDV